MSSTSNSTLASKEPVAVYSAIALLISTAAAAIGVTVDPSTLVDFALAAIAFVSYVVAAVKARSKVTPVA